MTAAPAKLTEWDRLIRYVSAQDHQTYYGEPILDSSSADIDRLATQGQLRVHRLAGPTALKATRTGQEDTVKKLLGPLTPEEVPIIRCTGINYLSHIHEMRMPTPENPTLFMKSRQAVHDTQAPVPIPKIAQAACDYEGELTVVIGRDCKNVTEADALNYVAGYTASNDVSCRDWQIEKPKAGGLPQWTFSKTFDKYAPLGPAIVSTSLLGDGKGLKLKTFVNGEQRQNGDTSDLHFSVRKLISFYSTGQTLEAGSLIMTGTPAGVGLGHLPPKYLKNRDEVVVEIDGIGKVRNKMRFE